VPENDPVCGEFVVKPGLKLSDIHQYVSE
jgi:hypothetical protein